MAKLKATRSILYLNRLYEAGEELPCYDEATVKAWVDAKSAVWEDEERDRAKSANPADATPCEGAETTADKKPASRAATATKRKTK